MVLPQNDNYGPQEAGYGNAIARNTPGISIVYAFTSLSQLGNVFINYTNFIKFIREDSATNIGYSNYEDLKDIEYATQKIQIGETNGITKEALDGIVKCRNFKLYRDLLMYRYVRGTTTYYMYGDSHYSTVQEAIKAKAAAINARGDEKYSNKDYVGALADYNAAIGLNPSNKYYHRDCARALKDLGRYDEAIATADRALSIDANYEGAKNIKAEAYNLKGNAENDLRERLKCYQEAEKLNSAEKAYKGNKHIIQAGIYIEQKNYGDAIREADLAIKADPDWQGHKNTKAKAYKQKVLSLIDSNRLSDAENAARAMAADSPEKQAAIEAIASAYKTRALTAVSAANILNRQTKIDKLNEAVTAYDRAIALNAGRVAEYRRSKEAVEQEITQLGNQIQAETHATTAATQLAEANNLMGQAKMDKLHEAKESFIKAQNLDFSRTSFYQSKAQELQEAIETLRREQGQIQKAKKLVEDALATDDIDRKVELYSEVVNIFPNAKLSEAVNMLRESKNLSGGAQFNKIKDAFDNINSAIGEDSQYKGWAQDLFDKANNRLEKAKKILRDIQRILGHKTGKIDEVVDKIDLLDNGASYPFIKAALAIVDLKKKIEEVRKSAKREQRELYLELLKKELEYCNDFNVREDKKSKIRDKIADVERNLNHSSNSEEINEKENDIQQLETTTIPALLQQAHQNFNLVGRGSIDKNRSDYISEIFEAYYVEGMKNILDLRIRSLGHYTTNENIVLARSHILDLNENNDISKLVSDGMGSKLTIIPLLVLPELKNYYHWVGLILDRLTSNAIKAIYFDSENQSMPIKLRDNLINSLKELNKECKVLYEEVKTEQQKYNNCGSELIENIVLYLTGERVSQEGAFYLHSALFEAELTGKVLNSQDTIQQIKNNIETQSFNLPERDDNFYSGCFSTQYALNGLNYIAIENDNNHNNLNDANLAYTSKIVRKEELFSSNYKLFSMDFIVNLFSKLDVDLGLETKKLIYRSDVALFKELLKKYKIDSSINILSDIKGFKKSVLLKLHPDKGGDHQDFIFAKTLHEKFAADLDISKIIDSRINAIQPVIYKTINAFQILDSGVDIIKFGYEPTMEHAKKLAYDTAYIYSMYKGLNGYSSLISCVDIIYKSYNYEYVSALQQLSTTLSFMALPAIMEYTNIPYFRLVYSTAMMTYAGYNAINNLYSFITGGRDSEINSYMAYRDLAIILSDSPLQNLIDFDFRAKRYALEINKLKSSIEKETIKVELMKKGEYGQKLYDYIYARLIEEKYELENKALEGLINQEDARSIYTEQISISSKDFTYEHCILVKDLSNADNYVVNQQDEQRLNNKYYYCHNDLFQQIDHVMIGLDHIEIIKHL